MFQNRKIPKIEPLTKEQIENIFKNTLNPIADRAGADYALIGGALFTVLGIPGYETNDIDVAATASIDGYGLKSQPRDQFSSPGTSNNYRIGKVKLDWMVEGTPGSRKLYQAAIESGYLSDGGVWVANLEHAMAIKLHAGRPQDIEVYNEFLDSDLINDKLVKDLLRMYTNRIMK